MRCHVCGKPATCIGAYEGQGLEQPACDDCCGHGCEDGKCRPIATPCEACGGSGQVVVGEHYVTMDMAIDAGDRSLAGMSCGPEWGVCDVCDGGGLREPREPQAVAKDDSA